MHEQGEVYKLCVFCIPFQTSLSADQYSKRTRNAVTRLNPSRINMDLIVVGVLRVMMMMMLNHYDSLCCLKMTSRICPFSS